MVKIVVEAPEPKPKPPKPKFWDRVKAWFSRVF